MKVKVKNLKLFEGGQQRQKKKKSMRVSGEVLSEEEEVSSLESSSEKRASHKKKLALTRRLFIVIKTDNIEAHRVTATPTLAVSRQHKTGLAQDHAFAGKFWAQPVGKSERIKITRCQDGNCAHSGIHALARGRKASRPLCRFFLGWSLQVWGRLPFQS